MAARTSSRAVKEREAEMGVSSVAPDHRAMPAASTGRPPNLSATAPPMRGVRAYPHRKADWEGGREGGARGEYA